VPVVKVKVKVAYSYRGIGEWWGVVVFLSEAVKPVDERPHERKTTTPPSPP